MPERDDLRPGRRELWVHPRSLARDADRQAEGMARSGIAAVRLAASYHAGRWLLTTGSPGEVAYLADSVPAFPVRPARYGVLRPPTASEPSAAGFPAAATALRGAGLGVTGWLVALHNSPLASSNPELALRNVFGTRYRHALCPARAEVAEYVVALAGDLAGQDVDGLDIEALGYLGWAHGGHHEKVGVPLRPVDVYLLSLCICPACRAVVAAHGGDVDRIVHHATRELRGQLTDPQPEQTDVDVADMAAAVLGAADHAAVQAARAEVVLALVDRVSAAVRVPVDLRASGRTHEFVGKSSGDLGRLAAAVDSVTVTSLTTDLRAIDEELGALDRRGVPHDRITVGLSMMHPHLRSEPEFARALEHLEEAGISRSCWYGYGLAPSSRLSWFRADARGPRPSERAGALT